MEKFVSSYESILFINEDHLFCRVIRFYLEDCGFKVYDAQNGDDALKYYERINPDLIITDLHIKSSKCIDLMDLFKSKTPQTPIVIMSDERKKEEVMHALRLGAWDYIFKPISNIAILEHIVCKALEHSRLLKENELNRNELNKKNSEINQSLEELKDDYKTGKRVQGLLLPKRDIQYNDLNISHKFIPSIDIGGNFVDYFKIDQNKVGCYILHASGHDTPSGFTTIFLKNRIEQLLIQYHHNKNNTIIQPASVLEYINNEIFNLKSGKHLNMIYCVLDSIDNLLIYSVGGHHPNPILWNRNEASFLSGGGVAIGIQQNIKYENKVCKLPVQFTLGLFSTSILNVLKKNKRIKSDMELLQLLNNIEPDIDKILSTVSIDNKTELQDDIAVLLMNKSKAIPQNVFND